MPVSLNTTLTYPLLPALSSVPFQIGFLDSASGVGAVSGCGGASGVSQS